MKKFLQAVSVMLTIFVWMLTPLLGQSTCETPTGINVFEITTNSAQVTWVNEDTVEMQWYVFVYPTNQGTAYGWETFTSTDTVTLTDLLPNTNYTVCVQTYCGEDTLGESLYSEWSNTYAFTTACGVISVTPENTYSIIFGNDDVHCWSWDTIAGNSGWYIGNNGYFFGNEYGSSNANDSARLLSPFFDLTQMERPRLNFYFLRDLNHDISAYYRTGVNAEWILLADYPYEGNGSWESATLRLPNVDSCQLSFVATGTTSGYRSVQMGSLSIYEYPSCVAPTELTVVNFPAANQVTLSWTNVNDSVPASWTVYIRDNYSYEYREITVTDTFVTVGNLDFNRTYYWSVKANCAEEDESDWSGESGFSTTCGGVYVVTPENPYQMGFEDDGAPCWTPGGYGYSLQSYGEQYSGYYSGNVYNGSLTSPLFDLTQLENPTLTFFFKQTSENVDTLFVSYRTNETEEFQLLSKYEVKNDYWFVVDSLPFDTVQVKFYNTTENYVYLDDITIGERPSCLIPSHFEIDTVTTHSVTLNWTPAGDETEWTLHIEDWGDTVVTTHPFTIEGLQENRFYYVSVRANCGADDFSEWLNDLSFQTPCATFTVDDENIFMEDFEDWNYGTLPECWGFLTSTYNSYYGDFPMTIDFSPFGGEKSLGMYVRSGYSNSFYMNEFTNAINTLQVSFNINNNQQDALMTLEVGVMEDGVFVPVKTLRSLPQYSYQRVLLSQYEGNGNRIAFRASTTNSYCFVFIDNIEVKEIKCLVPTDVTVYGVTKDSAVVTWLHDTLQNPASWTVRLFDGYNYTETTVTTDTAVFSNLTAGTRYTAQVRANCNATDVSDWSDEVFFDTDCDVYVVTPENPYVEDFEVYPVCWNVDSYNWEWIDNAHSGEKGFYIYDPTIFDGNVVSPVFDLTAMENPMLSFFHRDDVAVYYRTRESGIWLHLSDCWQDDYDGYKYEHILLPNATATYQIKFVARWYRIYLDDIMINEEPDCMIPSDVTIDNSRPDSVLIGWTVNGSETAWTIRLNGVETVVTENPVMIAVDPGMEYTVSVRANCTDTTFSEWSYGYDFVSNCAEVYVVTSTQPYHEGFEHEFCWHNEAVAGYNAWYIGDTTNLSSIYVYEGAKIVYCPYTDGARALLYSPVLDLSQLAQAQMNFQVRTSSDVDDESRMTTLQVLYRTSDTTDWHLLESYTGLSSDYTRMAINLTDLTATYQIGFLSFATGEQNILLDDINVFELVPCAEPTNVTVENNVATWTGNAPSYNVKVSVGGVVVDEATVNTNSYTVRGLEEGDYAIIRVQAVCDEENLSDWTEGDVFVITGIESFGLNATVYPNPTTGVVNIEGATLNADIAVFDMFGKQMLAGKVTSERTELDLGGLTSGVYIIRIATNGEVTTVKVVKE